MYLGTLWVLGGAKPDEENTIPYSAREQSKTIGEERGPACRLTACRSRLTVCSGPRLTVDSVSSTRRRNLVSGPPPPPTCGRRRRSRPTVHTSAREAALPLPPPQRVPRFPPPRLRRPRPRRAHLLAGCFLTLQRARPPRSLPSGACIVHWKRVDSGEKPPREGLQ